MKAIEPADEKVEAKKKKVAFGAAGISLFLHLGLFILIGGVVVVEYAVPRSPMTGELSPVVNSDDLSAVEEESPETMGEPESAEPVSDMPAASAESAPIELNVSTVDVLSMNTPVSSFQMPASLSGTGGNGSAAAVGAPAGGGGGGVGKPGKITNPFGNFERLGNASLEGVLYDLKQTKNGKPSGMDVKKYIEVLQDFFKNWNRNVLNEYHRVKKPLYASQIYMPLMPAGAAPQAFKVENEVKPSQWVILYSGTFQAPESGTYRLAGYADDVLAVRINDKTVLDASRTSLFEGKKTGEVLAKVRGQEEISSHKIGNGYLAYSEWLRFDEGVSNKIEILVGERPGGQFCAYLLVEQRNKTYKKEASGRPILPLFRTADMETTPSKEAAFEADGPVFGVK